MKFPIVRRGVLLAAPIGNQDVFTLTFPQVADQHNNRTGSPLHRPGNKLETVQIVQKGRGKASNFTQKPAKGFKKHK